MKEIWIVYLFLAAFPALIVFVAIYKYVEVAQAGRWPSTPGRVVLSTSETRSVRTGGPNSDDSELRNFARIEYTYTVAGQPYRGRRVSIGEDLGNFEVAETIARYPVGKTVTVYYNPNRRQQAVLERDLPPGIWQAITYIVLALVVLIVGTVVGFGRLVEVMRNVVANPSQAPFVTGCFVFALATALFAFIVQKRAMAARMWPRAPGRIESSGVHEFQARNSSYQMLTRWSTRFRTAIRYSYMVGRVRYTGDKITLGGQFSATTDAFARRGASRYAQGSTVEVYYNPQNPAECVLQPRAAGLWLVWLAALALLVLAFVIAR